MAPNNSLQPPPLRGTAEFKSCDKSWTKCQHTLKFKTGHGRRLSPACSPANCIGIRLVAELRCFV